MENETNYIFIIPIISYYLLSSNQYYVHNLFHNSFQINDNRSQLYPELN